MSSKYYLTEVDKNAQSVYCYHNLMGETYIEPHTHEKDQFIYTEGGVVYVKTDSCTYYLPARHYMWIPAGVKHAIYPSSTEVIMRNLYFPIGTNTGSFYKREGIYPANNLVMELLLFTKKWKGDIIKSQEQQYAIVNALKVLLAQTVPQSLPLELPQPSDGRLINIIEYLTNNINKEHFLPELASSFRMTDKSLYRLFKKDLGMSFIRYYTQLRVFKSLEYLMNPDYTISEIAHMVGYNSLPTFSTTFSKIMGKRPSEYRKSNEIYLEP